MSKAKREKITLEHLNSRLKKIESILREKQKENKEKKLQIAVLRLDWEHHGWEGDPEELPEDRKEWAEAQEFIDLVRKNTV
jgi:hypothetical protein